MSVVKSVTYMHIVFVYIIFHFIEQISTHSNTNKSILTPGNDTDEESTRKSVSYYVLIKHIIFTEQQISFYIDLSVF